MVALSEFGSFINSIILISNSTYAIISLMPKSRGFSLIELLVVISIIAILAVVGVAVFSNVQKSVRDARRRADIDAIAKAMEVKMSATYQGPKDNYFAGGKMPYDPNTTSLTDKKPGCGDPNITDGYGNHCWYCVRSGNATPDYCTASAGWLNIDVLNNSTGWLICANLESGSPAYFCKGSSQ